MAFSQKKILVVGLGKSGLSVCRYLRGQGALVTASEFRERKDLDRTCLEEVLRLGVILETGGHSEETFLGSEMIVVSPGVPLDIGPLKAARAAGIPILGEMELAGRLLEIPIVAVTGTNGKSTVTALLGHMMEKAGRRAFVGGNIGTPLMDCVIDSGEAELAVAEVSSFQLDTMEVFHPAVSMILNISPDHLDRYADYEAYAASKLRVFENQTEGDVVILNDDDERLSRIRPGGGVNVLRYGLKGRSGRHAFMEDGRLKAFTQKGGRCEFAPDEFPLPGNHNLQNLMGAVLAGLALGVEPGMIQKAINTFRGLSHRLEYIGRFGEVDFYDDSKATNEEAASRSVEGFDRPVILIAGGRHKGGDYAPLVKASSGRVRKAILLGEARERIQASLEGTVPVSLAGNMMDAVQQAVSSAHSGDVVLLAPACSSFDMFTDYAQRGRVFRMAVEKLGHGR